VRDPLDASYALPAPRGTFGATIRDAMDDQPTCGKGLAAHAALPAKLADLFAAIAQNLAEHMKALDLADAAARQEHDAYARLVAEHRALAAEAATTAAHMAGYRDLPMGAHDAQAMASAEVRAAFERYVTVKRELSELLAQEAAEDQEMLVQMGG